jgi:hypothetical protein
MEAGLTAVIGAAPLERTEARTSQRKGFRPRSKWVASTGALATRDGVQAGPRP